MCRKTETSFSSFVPVEAGDVGQCFLSFLIPVRGDFSLGLSELELIYHGVLHQGVKMKCVCAYVHRVEHGDESCSAPLIKLQAVTLP